jgi:hypothetical protein
MGLKSFFTASSTDWRHRLAVRGRSILDNSEFDGGEHLYRGFCLADLDDNGDIGVASFESRDLSCNWSRFSIPSDIQHRERGRDTDGCYSIAVETARYKSLATPCHDPIQRASFENYAHVEIRWLMPDESADFVPPHGRKNPAGKVAKASRLEWRTNAVLQAQIELDASA